MWRAAKALFATIMVVVAAAVLALSTTTGQSLVMRQAINLFGNGQIAIGELNGSLFGQGSLAEISLSDTDGRWLTLHGISFSWAPSQLFSGRFSVEHLRVENITVARLPSSEPSVEQNKTDAKSSFALPLAVRIGDLDVKTIDIREAVAGESVKLRVSGSADLNDVAYASQARLAVARLDGAKGELLAMLSYSPERRALELKIDGNEPEGGTVSRLLGMPSRPAISLRVNGNGVLDAWRADLALTADGTPFVAGAVHVDALSNGRHRIKGQVAGYIEKLVPAALGELLAGRLDGALTVDVAGLNDGSPRSLVDAHVELSSNAIRFSATGGGDLTTGFFHGHLSGRIGREDGQSLRLTDVSGRPVTVREIAIQASLPHTPGARQLTAQARVNGIVAEQVMATSVTLDARATQPEPAGDRANVLDDIAVTVSADGVAADGPLKDAVGPSARAELAGSYDGQRLSISKFDLDAVGAKAELTGRVDRKRLDAAVQLSISDLSRYAGAAARPLKGKLSINTKIDGDLEKQAFAATIKAQSDGVAAGIAAIDGLLAPPTSYAAHIERLADGTLRARDASITNAHIAATLAGRHGAGELALSAETSLASLAALDPRLTGTAHLALDIGGLATDLTSKLTLTGDNVTFDGKAVTEPRVSFAGRGPLSRHLGKLAVSAQMASEIVRGEADVVLSDSGTNRIDGLDLEIAGARLAGGVAIEPAALPSGQIELDAKNLGRLGRAIGVPLRGRLAADLELTRDVDNGLLRINVSGDDIVFGDIRLDGIRSSGRVSNYLAAPDGAVDLKVAQIIKGGQKVGSLSLDTRLNAGAATFKSSGQLQGGSFTIAGKARSANGHHDIDLETFSYAGSNDLPRIALAAPAHLSVRDGKAAMRAFQLAIGSGSLRVAGSASGDDLDLSVALKRVPATLAAVVAPDLGLAGTIDGNATIKGAPAKPRITASIAATGMSVRDMRDRQLPSIDVASTVTTVENRAKVMVKATARGGLEAVVDGTAGLDGHAPLALAIRGKIPLSLANVFLADRSARVSGTATLNADITGQLSDPRVNGSLVVNKATASDPASGLDLNDIGADIGFSTQKVDIRQLVARSKKGGQVTANGSVLLQPGADAAVDLDVRLAAFKFGDQDPIASELDGHVTVSGPLSALVAKGDVLIKRMDVTVPNALPQSVAALDIRHVNAPKGFQSTGRRAAKEQDAAPRAGPGVSLSVDVQAYDRIFVRGRGVDAQLGGLVKIRGTADHPVTDGRFSMTRGRLSIIGRQLDFSRGNIVFMGSLEPTLDMEAAADVDGTTVAIVVSGPASNPQFKFTSTPELPEDEIVSLLLFNKKLASLSPTQLVQLAGEIDKIGGLSSGPGTLDKMKSALGIDVLDVTTDKDGNAQATAGSYINDKTYVGVKQGMSLDNTRIVIDHNLTKHLKARGEMGTDGDSKLGLGFEWDY